MRIRDMLRRLLDHFSPDVATSRKTLQHISKEGSIVVSAASLSRAQDDWTSMLVLGCIGVKDLAQVSMNHAFLQHG